MEFFVGKLLQARFSLGSHLRADVRKLRGFGWFQQLSEQVWRVPMWTCLFDQVLKRVGRETAIEWLASAVAAIPLQVGICGV